MLLIITRTGYEPFSISTSMSLNDLEPLKLEVFCEFFLISGSDTEFKSELR